MSPAARLQTTLDLLHEVDAIAGPADALVSAFFRARRHIGEDDRGEIIGLFYALLRHHARLGWWLAGQGAEPTPRNRLLAWLTLGEGRSASQLAALLTGRNADTAPLTERERTLLSKLQGKAIDHPAMPESVRLECPDWALAPLQRRFGADFAREMAATLSPAPRDLRVNSIKANRPDMLSAMRSLGLPAEPTPLAPLGIRIDESLSLARLTMLKSGEVEIQDEGSQLVALLVDAHPGDRVVDFCAGAGGKTLAMAAQMANKGHVVACDVMEGRLRRAAERFRHAGVHNVQTRLLSNETDKWVKRHKAGFDRVLVDAPCSGTGTWRRNPDARWRASAESQLDALLPLQAKILTSAARLVRPGGRLVYATCSLLIEENEDQVAAFLAAHPDFELIPLASAAPDLAASTHPGFLSLTPGQHDTDGFFAAVMQRKAVEANQA